MQEGIWRLRHIVHERRGGALIEPSLKFADGDDPLSAVAVPAELRGDVLAEMVLAHIERRRSASHGQRQRGNRCLRTAGTQRPPCLLFWNKKGRRYQLAEEGAGTDGLAQHGPAKS